MRNLLFLGLFLVLIFPAFALPQYVEDQAGVLKEEEVATLEGILGDIFESKKAEYKIVIVESLDGSAIESYALNLVQGKLGDTETNNGLLLLVAIEDRKYRFEVGRGLEPIFNDAKVGRYGREYLVENFKTGEYGTGIIQASLAIAQELEVEVSGEVPSLPQNQSSRGNPYSWITYLIMFFIITSLIGGQHRKGKKRKDRYFDAALMAGMLMSGHRGRGRGGFGGSGGFGGGGFGGGGASGGW